MVRNLAISGIGLAATSGLVTLLMLVGRVPWWATLLLLVPMSWLLVAGLCPMLLWRRCIVIDDLQLHVFDELPVGVRDALAFDRSELDRLGLGTGHVLVEKRRPATAWSIIGRDPQNRFVASAVVVDEGNDSPSTVMYECVSVRGLRQLNTSAPHAPTLGLPGRIAADATPDDLITFHLARLEAEGDSWTAPADPLVDWFRRADRRVADHLRTIGYLDDDDRLTWRGARASLSSPLGPLGPHRNSSIPRSTSSSGR